MARDIDIERRGAGARDRGIGMEVLERIGLPVVLGWLAIAIGLVLVIAGYWRVSGTSDVAQQLAYFASTCVGGLFALGVGGVLILSNHYRETARATGEMRRALAHLARDAGLAGGYEPTSDVRRSTGDGDFVVCLAGSRTFHRGDCVFVEGRSGAAAMSLAEAGAAGLEPCQACDPPRPATESPGRDRGVASRRVALDDPVGAPVGRTAAPASRARRTSGGARRRTSLGD